MENNLFDETLLKKYSEKIQVTNEQRNIINEWYKLLEKGELENETQNYGRFSRKILENLFGYKYDENILENDPELHGQGNSEFKIKIDDTVFMIVELKGSKTDLDKKRDHESPVEQVFRYGAKNEGTPWLLLSNYNEFRLYNYNKGTHKSIRFTMEELYDDLKEGKLIQLFLSIFRKETYENKILEDILENTLIINKNFEKKFYKLYSQTRLMIMRILQDRNNMDLDQSVKYAQMILNISRRINLRLA